MTHDFTRGGRVAPTRVSPGGEHGQVMASLLSPRRSNAEVSLRTSDAVPQPPPTAADTPASPPIGWPLTAIACGLVTALASWVLCAGLAVVGWLAADPG